MTNNGKPTRARVATPSGRISYVEQGSGPVALFVHGVLLNSHLWRNQMAELSDIRRCIAVDLLAHGETETAPDQDVSVTANAEMLKQFLDAMNIKQVDVVANDNGPAKTQVHFFQEQAGAGRPSSGAGRHVCTTVGPCPKIVDKSNYVCASVKLH